MVTLEHCFPFSRQHIILRTIFLKNPNAISKVCNKGHKLFYFWVHIPINRVQVPTPTWHHCTLYNPKHSWLHYSLFAVETHSRTFSPIIHIYFLTIFVSSLKITQRQLLCSFHLIFIRKKKTHATRAVHLSDRRLNVWKHVICIDLFSNTVIF